MIQRFLSEDVGQGLVEYALIIGLVAMTVIAGLTILGNKNNNSLTNAANILS